MFISRIEFIHSKLSFFSAHSCNRVLEFVVHRRHLPSPHSPLSRPAECLLQSACGAMLSKVVHALLLLPVGLICSLLGHLTALLPAVDALVRLTTEARHDTGGGWRGMGACSGGGGGGGEVSDL